MEQATDLFENALNVAVERSRRGELGAAYPPAVAVNAK
jgi:hypothetical protein